MIRDLNYIGVYNIFVYKKSTKTRYSENSNLSIFLGKN